MNSSPDRAELTRAAFPHSEIPGSRVVSTSPRLIAADHVLRRLSAPEHPPHTLSSLTTEFDESIRSAVWFFVLPSAGPRTLVRAGGALVIVSRFHFGTPVHMSKTVPRARCAPESDLAPATSLERGASGAEAKEDGPGRLG